MPRYFFNTHVGDELISDPEGEDLRNPDRAWETARTLILALLKTEGADERLCYFLRRHQSKTISGTTMAATKSAPMTTIEAM